MFWITKAAGLEKINGHIYLLIQLDLELCKCYLLIILYLQKHATYLRATEIKRYTVTVNNVYYCCGIVD